MEIWKDIQGYEGIYQVSSLGRVKSLYNRDRATHRAEHILSQSDNRGYRLVALCKNGKMKSYSVHRLVAKAFLEKEEGKDFVDHINTIKDDNRAINLRWVTELENNRNELTRLHRIESKRGEKNPNYGSGVNPYLLAYSKEHRRAVEQIDSDGRVINEYESVKDASTATSVTASNIGRVCNGIRQTAGGYKWRFKDD